MLIFKNDIVGVNECHNIIMYIGIGILIIICIVLAHSINNYEPA